MLFNLRCWLAVLLLTMAAQPALAQADITVLDHAQDGSEQPAVAPAETVEAPADPAAPPPICGTQPISIAKMSWPSAAILAEIHVLLLREHFKCDVGTVPGDLAATGSSMGSTGQPAVAPEMWLGRIADVWNPAIKAQMVRPAAATFKETVFEGWFMPDYLATGFPALKTATALKDGLSAVAGGAKVKFISCPIDWGCAIINRNLIKALGIESLVDIVEPANRFEMDTLIAAAVGKKEPVLFYYWQPNAVLAQFKFEPIDLGAYNQEALQCLARTACATPTASSFASESVVIALAEWVFTDVPAIAGYFQRATLSLAEMDKLLAQLNEPGATEQSVAQSFVAKHEDIWRSWVGAGAP